MDLQDLGSLGELIAAIAAWSENNPYSFTEEFTSFVYSKVTGSIKTGHASDV
jgi:hypothetical protein